MKELDSDDVSFLVVVRGPDERAIATLSERFPNRYGGAKPGPQPREVYQVVPCKSAELCESLAWVAESLSGQYRLLELSISIHTPRNWANFIVPDEVVRAANQHGAALSVHFSSPAIK